MNLVIDDESTNFPGSFKIPDISPSVNVELQPDTSDQTAEIFNQKFHKIELPEEGITFYLPELSSVATVEMIDLVISTIQSALSDLAEIYPDNHISHAIILCPEELYKKRLSQKIKRMGDEPAPWIDWSEGDIENVEGIGTAFCVRLGAHFESDGDRFRFFAHELAHPYTYQVSQIFLWSSPEKMLALAEGLVEADARISLAIQERPDMAFSTYFIQNLDPDQLALPADIETLGYDHKSFISATVSLNPGYLSCLLWFYGIAVSIGNGEGLSQKFHDGRQRLIEIAKGAQTKNAFKSQLLLQTGFDYDKNASDRKFLLDSRKHFLSEYMLQP